MINENGVKLQHIYIFQNAGNERRIKSPYKYIANVLKLVKRICILAHRAQSVNFSVYAALS